MASLSKDGSGWRIVFYCPTTTKRRTIRTGKATKKSATTALNMVENLIEAKSLGQAINQQTAAWLESIEGTPLRERLAKAGLCNEMGKTLLGPFVASYIDGRNDVKPASKTVWRQGEASLNEYFGEDKPVHTITVAHAEDFKQWLVGKLGSMYTVRKRIQSAKMFFNAMVSRGVIRENPFKRVKVTAAVDESRNQYIPRETITEVMEEAPDAEWRAMIALSRFGGLRLPSEVLSLKWDDINWDRHEITVTSPKTERHAGKGRRTVPLFPELVKPLLEASEQAPNGAVYVVTRHRSQAEGPDGWKNCNLRTRFFKMVRRAGYESWPKPFHAMRASFETDLIDAGENIHDVAGVLGHSPEVALEHYVRMRKDNLQQMRQRGELRAAQKLTQKPAHSTSIPPNQVSSRKEQSPAKTGAEEGWPLVTNPPNGWERIRTPGGLSPSAVFKTAALDHSATHPSCCRISI